MTTAAESEVLTRVGPGTPMAELVRHDERCLQAKRWTVEYLCLGWPRYPRPALGCRAANFEPIDAGTERTYDDERGIFGNTGHHGVRW